MIVHPRHEWTVIPAKSNAGADRITGSAFYRDNQVVGIEFISPDWYKTFAHDNPRAFFKHFQHEAQSEGLSDVKYSLGVANNVAGVWNLRGLHNKSSASFDPNHNGTHLSVIVLLGKTEKPTDVLLGNILDARRLVLSRYPGATSVVRHDTNPYLAQLFSKKSFWKETDSPVGSYQLPVTPLLEGQQSVHVQELQDLLAYWGYYKQRVDGVYNVQTRDAVTALQADLADAGFFFREHDGIYSEHVYRAWSMFLESLT